MHPREGILVLRPFRALRRVVMCGAARWVGGGLPLCCAVLRSYMLCCYDAESKLAVCTGVACTHGDAPHLCHQCPHARCCIHA